MSRGTGSLTEDAIAQILKGTDVVDLLKAKEANEEITAAEKARKQQERITKTLALGPENEVLDSLSQQVREARTRKALAPRTTEILDEFTKEVKGIRQRRSLGSPPPKFTRGTPKKPVSPELALAQVVQAMLDQVKNIELPTEETTDA